MKTNDSKYSHSNNQRRTSLWAIFPEVIEIIPSMNRPDTDAGPMQFAVHSNVGLYRKDIDGLRAVAVLSVIAFHAGLGLRGGFTGVDIFFVISGYLISLQIYPSISKGSFSFTDFYFRRARRIFPALVVVLAASLAFGWFTLLPDDLSRLGKHVVAAAGFYSNFVYWSESGYFDAAAEAKPLLHIWSLAIEEQFYLFWPVFLFAAFRTRVVLAWITAALLTSLIYNLHASSEETTYTFFSPGTRAWELLAGAMLAYAQLYVPPQWRRSILTPSSRLADLCSILGAGLVVIGLCFLKGGLTFPGKQAIVPVLGSTLLIGAGAEAFVNRRVLSLKAFQWVGLISYPLYLWHWPLLSFAATVEHLKSPPVRAALMVAAFPLAFATYYFAEKPIRSGALLKTKILMPTIGLAAVSLFGALIFLQNGFSSRLSPLVRELLAFQTNNGNAVTFKEHECFLVLPDQTYKDFAACKPAIGAMSERKRILLWGDSHAAHLRAGLSATYGAEYEIIQRSATSCAPTTDDYNPLHCDDINTKVLEEVAANHFAKVFIAARWWAHNWNSVAKTISDLQKAGVSDIVLVGPPPNWEDSLPKDLARYAMARNISDFAALPRRLNIYLNKENEAKNIVVEHDLRDIAVRTGVHYISLHDLLCNELGCLTRVGTKVSDLITADGDHFPRQASIYVVSKFREQYPQ